MQMSVSLARKIDPNCIMISHYFMSAVVCHGVACNMQLDLTLACRNAECQNTEFSWGRPSPDLGLGPVNS